jgi:hypothetical protein
MVAVMMEVDGSVEVILTAEVDGSVESVAMEEEVADAISFRLSETLVIPNVSSYHLLSSCS